MPNVITRIPIGPTGKAYSVRKEEMSSCFVVKPLLYQKCSPEMRDCRLLSWIRSL